MDPGRFFRMSPRSNWSQNFIDFVYIILFLAASGYPAVQGCWGSTSPNYGHTTPDYQLLVGKVLVLNCTLNVTTITVDKKDYDVTSSDLLFNKGRDKYFSREFVSILDKSTAQLKIPDVTVKDSGDYHCSVSVGNATKPRHVCSTRVSVGYKPKAVQDFRCLSMFYENLTCTWGFESSRVATDYHLYRHYKFTDEDRTAQLQLCPTKSSNNSYCQWRSDTDPPYDKRPRILTFTIDATNDLGTYRFNFTVDHYAIILPRKPEDLTVTEITEQTITVQWSAPKNLEDGKVALQYQLEIKDPDGQQQVFDVGVDVFNYTVQDLIPYTVYTVSVRCRSNYTSREDMWSAPASVTRRTVRDVPYMVPETIPEAFEILHYQGYRSVNLYWKPISSKYHNAENFTYHVKCFHAGSDSERIPCQGGVLNKTCPAVTFEHLRENVSYDFILYSANTLGLSHNYSVITVERKENILPLPEDITVISTDYGHYEMSWKHSKNTVENDARFVVFWCSSLKPSISRCEGPLQWLETQKLNTTLPPLPDKETNFQFAVAVTSGQQCSGMRWASCIVPYKAALSKIENLDAVPFNSTSLTVRWSLKCAAQKAVVEKFEIIYCRLDENNQCPGKEQFVFIHDREKEIYILNNLTPFRNYSVVIRAYKDGVPSENSDRKIVRTAEGAPSDPPQDTRAVVLEHDTIEVSWHSPSKPNGLITRYVIYVNGKPQEKEVLADNKIQVYSHSISGLEDYSNYNIQVQACVKTQCSPLSQELWVQTDIGAPGEMDPPWIESINSSFVKVSWNSPSKPNGPIDFYEVHWKTEEEANSTSEEKGQTVIVRGVTAEIGLNCESVKDKGVTYLFSVRAANYKDNVTLYGPFSSPKKATGCFMTPGLAMIIGIAIGGTLALAFTALLLFKLIKWMKDKIDQFKSITVELPKGLNGPESNQLNNYYNFMNGLSHPKSPSKGVETLSYAIGDTESKNRHGSGSSQYSNASTDELLYRVNGKCTKFGRKPSGESSGCSSMSSNTINTIRTPLSSDSGAESDFHAPPSPDMIFGDHKSPLPIVMESQDSSLQETDPVNQTDQVISASNNKQHTQVTLNNSNTLPNGMVVKMDQPYSKFGIARNAHTVPPWWMNPLAFYSCHLANSEPSVLGLEESSEQSIKAVPMTLAPYSKVGLARSSGDILRMPNVEQGLGYSKFGIIRNVERSQSNPYTRRDDSSLFPQDLMSPTVGVAVVDVKPIASESRLPQKYNDNFGTQQGAKPSNVPHKPNLNYLDPRNLSPYISFKQFTQKNGFVQPRDEELVYTNAKAENQTQTSAPDYVAVNEIQGLSYTPKRNATEPSSDQLLSVISENENYNMATGEEVLNDVEPNEMQNLFENHKFDQTELSSNHVIDIAPSGGAFHPYLNSDSESTEPKGSLSWNKVDYLKSPAEDDVNFIPPHRKEDLGQSSDNMYTVSQNNDTEVSLDTYKRSVPLLQHSPLKTQTEDDFVPTAPLVRDDTTNSVFNNSPKDLSDEHSASERNHANKTDMPKEFENSSCSTQANVGYVPFVSLISCGNSQRNSSEVNATRDAVAPEPCELTLESVNSTKPETHARGDLMPVASRADSSDFFKVPEQHSARDHPTDSKPGLHLSTNSQQGTDSDVICDQTCSIYESPRCTKQSISVNGSLDPRFRLVPMVDSEICEV